MPLPIPDQPEDLGTAFVGELVREIYPDARVETCEIVKISRCGEQNVSTSARAALKLTYSGRGAEKLPERVMAKMSMNAATPDDVWTGRLYPYYENEVNFYSRVRPTLNIETPMTLGARFDSVAKRYVLLLEDMKSQSVHFSSMTDDTSVEEVEGVLDLLAKVHACHWDAPALKTDFAWMSTHVGGPVESFRRQFVYDGMRQEAERYKIKQEILADLGLTVEDIIACVHAVKAYQNRSLPQMLLHGDTHLGNTYRKPDGTGGVYDWQNFCRGYGMFDVTYYLNTALSIDKRRKHERELLTFYRDRLGVHGVAKPPSMESLWLEHRRQSLVSFSPGWFCTPVINYGWEILTVGLLRLSTAVKDLESRKAIAPLL